VSGAGFGRSLGHGDSPRSAAKSFGSERRSPNQLRRSPYRRSETPVIRYVLTPLLRFPEPKTSSPNGSRFAGLFDDNYSSIKGLFIRRRLAGQSVNFGDGVYMLSQTGQRFRPLDARLTQKMLGQGGPRVSRYTFQPVDGLVVPFKGCL
jgi:hypothetical protein